MSRWLLPGAAFVALLYAGSYLRGRRPDSLPPAALSVPGSEVEVQVLNESGLSRGAQRLTRLLREKGFDVVEMGNGNRVGLEKTEVVVAGDDMEKGARVARAINCEFVRADPAPDLMLDVTVLVGKDIEKLVQLPD